MKAVTDADSVISLEFDDEYSAYEVIEGTVAQQIVNELQEYFSGKRKVFTLNLKPQGTVFQIQVCGNCIPNSGMGEAPVCILRKNHFL